MFSLFYRAPFSGGKSWFVSQFLVVLRYLTQTTNGGEDTPFLSSGFFFLNAILSCFYLFLFKDFIGGSLLNSIVLVSAVQ